MRRKKKQSIKVLKLKQETSQLSLLFSVHASFFDVYTAAVFFFSFSVSFSFSFIKTSHDCLTPLALTRKECCFVIRHSDDDVWRSMVEVNEQNSSEFRTIWAF